MLVQPCRGPADSSTGFLWRKISTPAKPYVTLPGPQIDTTPQATDAWLQAFKRAQRTSKTLILSEDASKGIDRLEDPPNGFDHGRQALTEKRSRDRADTSNDEGEWKVAARRKGKKKRSNTQTKKADEVDRCPSRVESSEPDLLVKGTEVNFCPKTDKDAQAQSSMEKGGKISPSYLLMVKRLDFYKGYSVES